MRLRNWLYDRGHIRSHGFTIPIISWGNLSVGGTGKSPHTEYLAILLLKLGPVGILSRGYGRKTKGYKLATDHENAETVGDEPWQYFLRFSGAQVAVAVHERRAEGIPMLLADAPETETIILDDAYQHRRVKPGLQLLLTTWDQPFWRQEVLPAGWLREPKDAAKRAHALVISKCPASITHTEMQRLTKEAKPYLAAGVPVFFSKLEYGMPKHVLHVLGAENHHPSWQDGMADHLGGFCGLASPMLFQEQVQVLGGKKTFFKAFPDHVPFSREVLDRLQKEGQSQGVQYWLCTAKDRAKLMASELAQHPLVQHCYYLPMNISFIPNVGAPDFDTWVMEQVQKLRTTR